MNSIKSIGLIGILLYVLISLQALYWLYQPICSKDKQVKYLKYKYIFQCLFIFHSLLEIIYYISLFILQEYTLWGYGFHKFALFLAVVLFAMVINLWGYALNIENTFMLSTFYGIILISINFIITVLDIAILSMSSSYSNYTLKLTASTTPTIINVLSLIILVIILLVHSIQLTQKLNQSYRPSILAIYSNQPTTVPRTSSDSSVAQTKLSLIYRIHGFLQVCFWCYMIRITLLSIKVYERVSSGVNTGIIYHLPLLVWFILTNWIPNIIPSVLFIYIMRTTVINNSDRNGHHSSDQRHTSSSSFVSWYYSECDNTITPSVGGNYRESSIETSTRITISPLLQFKSVDSQKKKTNRLDSNEVIEV